MKDILKKWWFYVVIIAILVLITIIVLIINNNSKSIYYNYKEQSIDILNDYKNGILDSESTGEKLYDLSDNINQEMSTDTKSKSDVLLSAFDLSSYCRDLAFNISSDYYTISDIDENIKKIEDLEL